MIEIIIPKEPKFVIKAPKSFDTKQEALNDLKQNVEKYVEKAIQKLNTIPQGKEDREH